MELLNKTIIECFKKRVRTSPDKTAVIYVDETYTWKELDEISDMLSMKLMEIGIGRNTHAAVCIMNNPVWITTFLALQKLESITMLVNPYCKEKELSELIVNADIEYFCYSSIYEETNFTEVLSNIELSGTVKFKEFIDVGKLTEDINESCQSEFNVASEVMTNVIKKDINQTACILFTSGTTSVPKGVMLSHKSIVNTSKFAVRAMNWNCHDIICVSVPLYHSFGLSACFIASIHCGCAIVLLEKNKTIKIFEAVEKNKCTVLNGVPSMFLAMINNPKYTDYDLSSLNSGIIAGSYIPKKEFMKICSTLNMRKLQMSYGLTEASPSVTFSDYTSSIKEKSDNVGKAIPGVELCILNDRSIKTQNAYEKGEILVRGFNVMKGYYNNTEETKKTIDEDGWLHTGDMGYLNEDENLHIVGRKKEVIIRCGENISPYEIEECILNYPGIVHVKVMGVKSEVTQEEIAACIVLENSESIDYENLRKYLGENLSYYKVPKYILEFDSFTMTASGKIDLKKLSFSVNEKLNAENDQEEKI
jgi:fatty-acyl-CoA synthase